jgi:hypothetical protein
MCADIVKVVVHDAGLPQHEAVVANLEDISPSGACVQLEAGIREGADVEIICSACRLKGKVRYCRFVTIGYDVGISFDERESWARQRFEPDHLLDVPSSGHMPCAVTSER